mmetsp:Transcript_19551/g.32053  ORF Transcript_19551/g.32053 Transcript_19551/m.32053 type:complete len:222 (+) Transcript_19551:54-719(+)
MYAQHRCSDIVEGAIVQLRNIQARYDPSSLKIFWMMYMALLLYYYKAKSSAAQRSNQVVQAAKQSKEEYNSLALDPAFPGRLLKAATEGLIREREAKQASHFFRLSSATRSMPTLKWAARVSNIILEKLITSKATVSIPRATWLSNLAPISLSRVGRSICAMSKLKREGLCTSTLRMSTTVESSPVPSMVSTVALASPRFHMARHAFKCVRRIPMTLQIWA